MKSKKTACLFVLLATALLVPGPVLAATINVPGDHSTIQNAINAAADGDTVEVEAGNYLENIDFSGRAITVVSVDGAVLTTIDGNLAGSVVVFQSGEGSASVLEGFTIRNGSGTNFMGVP